MLLLLLLLVVVVVVVVVVVGSCNKMSASIRQSESGHFRYSHVSSLDHDHIRISITFDLMS